VNLLVKIFVIFGSSASIGFGIWHFFVPKTWNWYSYIDGNATELVAAVRAINVFFFVSGIVWPGKHTVDLWRQVKCENRSSYAH